MLTPQEKRQLILQEERSFAAALAAQVIDKPRLSIWMILIPIIFVFFFYRFQKYVAGKKNFADHYLGIRERALAEALAVVEGGRPQALAPLLPLSDLPVEARRCHIEWLELLVDHFTDLLRAKGEGFDALIRSAYKSRSNYLLFLNRLNQAEKALNRALVGQLRATTHAVDNTVNAIEQASEKLRRERAEAVFGH
jgi:hypothetical protein